MELRHFKNGYIPNSVLLAKVWLVLLSVQPGSLAAEGPMVIFPLPRSKQLGHNLLGLDKASRLRTLGRRLLARGTA